MQSPAAIEITLRFKKAVEYARERDGWGTDARFCRRHGINTTQFSYTLATPESRALQPFWIAALCRDYKLSAEWILTGREKMLRGAKQAKTHKIPTT